MNETTTTADEKPAPNPWVKLGIEMGPLLIFFFANAKWGIFAATGAFMGAMVLAMIASLKLTGHIPRMMWAMAILVMVFGGLTLYLADETFIKLKPTIINLMFSAVLFAGLLRGRSYLRVVFEAGFPPMSDTGWRLMTRNYALFFLLLAGVNELVWRNFSTDTWVSFKVFGFLPLTLVFTFAQIFLLQKHMDLSEDEEASSDD